MWTGGNIGGAAAVEVNDAIRWCENDASSIRIATNSNKNFVEEITRCIMVRLFPSWRCFLSRIRAVQVWLKAWNGPHFAYLEYHESRDKRSRSLVNLFIYFFACNRVMSSSASSRLFIAFVAVHCRLGAGNRSDSDAMCKRWRHQTHSPIGKESPR